LTDEGVDRELPGHKLPGQFLDFLEVHHLFHSNPPAGEGECVARSMGSRVRACTHVLTVASRACKHAPYAYSRVPLPTRVDDVVPRDYNRPRIAAMAKDDRARHPNNETAITAP
jgi:hypothetical protein